MSRAAISSVGLDANDALLLRTLMQLDTFTPGGAFAKPTILRRMGNPPEWPFRPTIHALAARALVCTDFDRRGVETWAINSRGRDALATHETNR